MATPSQAGKAVPKKGSKKDRGEEAVEKFSVGQYVEKTEILSGDVINIDRELNHGQVRPVMEKNVQDLIQHYEVNEPDELTLTVVKDRGMPAVHLSWLFVIGCVCLT